MKLNSSILAVLLTTLGLVGCAGSGGIDSGKTETPVSINLPAGQQYVAYSATAENQLQAEGKPYAVFFHAQSCGTCRKNDAYFQENLAAMPAETTILKVDYPTASTELKQKYGITKYDSIAYVNADGTFKSKKGVRPNEVVAFFAQASNQPENTESNEDVVAEEITPEETSNALAGAPTDTAPTTEEPEVVLAVEPNNGIGDGATPLNELLEENNALAGAPDEANTNEEPARPNTPIEEKAPETELVVSAEENNALAGAPVDTPDEASLAVEPEREIEPATEETEAEITPAAADPVYTAYSAAAVRQAKADGKPYALFFHASWCPPCRRLDGKLNDGLANLPKGTLLFKTDYDEETELKKQYGVRSQHTLVTFNAAGEKTNLIQGFGFDDVENFFAQN